MFAPFNNWLFVFVVARIERGVKRVHLAKHREFMLLRWFSF